MQRIEFAVPGGVEVLTLLDSPSLPAPQREQLQVEVELAGVNFIDIYHRRGQYPLPLPSGIGLEGIGKVTALGPTRSDSSDFKVGDRVCWIAGIGSYSQSLVLASSAVTKIDSAISLPAERLLPLLLQGMTAHYLIDSAYQIRSDEFALVTAAAGGVGSLLVQLLKSQGAYVIALASTQERAAIAKALGADSVGIYQDIAPLVAEATGGSGVDVLYDSVGKEIFDSALAVIKPGGCYQLYGAASGAVPPFDLARLTSNSLAIRRPTLATYTRTHQERYKRISELVALEHSGKLNYSDAKIFPLTQVKDAHNLIESRTYSGKIGINPWKA